ncbi:unnamed protein product [Alopecurus aequalis]
MGSSRGSLQKQSPKAEADSGVSGGMLHEHLAGEADPAKGMQESDTNEIVHAKEEDTHLQEVQEVEDLIKVMDASCIGEPISDDEFLGYLNQLARNPRWINLDDKLEDKDIDEHEFKLQLSNGELLDDKFKSLLDISEEDCSPEYFEEEEFFRHFEKDMTLDWFFHTDYEECSSLTDYQRLVLRNYGGTEYGRWSEYHKYLHSYETENEYVKYCKELSQKLKWMENYLIYCPSFKWYCIADRGAFQAIKIAATGFQKITPTLAYNGFYECKESMSYDAVFFKEYDDVYFEIWRRVTQKSLSFKDALGEVCKLNIYTLCKGRMEGALECDYTMMQMEEEYQTCMEAITKKDTEDEARKLIAKAVLTLVTKPKSYEQYILKKIEIARVIGILPREDSEE